MSTPRTRPTQLLRLASDVFVIATCGPPTLIWFGETAPWLAWHWPWWVYGCLTSMALGGLLRHAWLMPNLFDDDVVR